MMNNNEIEKIYNLIINYNNYIWENRTSREDIENWVNNFKGKVIDVDNEKKMALDILSNFIYYNENEIKYLCRNAYIMFRRKKIKDFVLNGCSVYDAELLFDKYLEKCKFSYIGNPSESGSFILYHFRQMNDLPLSLFISLERWGGVSNGIDSLIFVDDFLGTGDTAVNFLKSLITKDIMKKDSNIELYYLVLVALKEGIDNVENNTNFNINIICPQIFDEEYRVFSDKSLVFPDKDKRDSARQVCESYGRDLEGKEYALGYKNSEALLGFHHNIPNNTLPIIWSDKEGWYPIFQRKKKIY